MKERKPNRLKDYDYSTEGYYFVTICVKDKKNVFGGIINDKMALSEYGEIVKKQWCWLEKQYNYIKLDEFSIMPNHFHGIIVYESVGNGRDRSLQSVKIKSLSEIIGAFKTTSSKIIHRQGNNTLSMAEIVLRPYNQK